MGAKEKKKYIKIIVELARNPEGDPVLAHYRITENVKMKRVKDDFAEKMNESVRLYRFLYYGERVADEDTAKTLEIEELGLDRGVRNTRKWIRPVETSQIPIAVPALNDVHVNHIADVDNDVEMVEIVEDPDEIDDDDFRPNPLHGDGVSEINDNDGKNCIVKTNEERLGMRNVDISKDGKVAVMAGDGFLCCYHE
ncbi:hypothetical protein GCK72_026189 [Caenorhabditis remanei]|uniref:Ubiquitin-like domain-containing protein n=1 Tax=Caenorhabditis remanei TaxID=31234 RepID=A0A6A5G4R3_CAERE|nr:hypothetical protein GCK72_026189 [Caenorhabditis remanei]KAF1749721.1 hypothetical protein GCK72_026189 [Caenorhabditis remanei]